MITPLPALSLIADIGGTNARFALVGPQGVFDERVLRCADYPSLADAVEAYLVAQESGRRPVRGAFAVASPITGDIIRMTNLPWEFSVEGVRRTLGFERLDVINDFTAVALAVPELTEADRVQIGEGMPEPGTPIGVLGPGSGLGVSALVPMAGSWTVLATEGGHVTMPPISDREGAILAQLRKTYEHVSAERLISGPGLVNLYDAIAFIDGQEPERLTAAEVSTRALERRDPACQEALDVFCAMLGTVAGNLALTLGARGGVYVAGGIAPKILTFLSHSRFRKRFHEKGRMRDYLNPIPTYVITHPYPAFVGLQAQLKRPVV